MTRRSTGPFREGDSVQLTDPKGRQHTVVLQPGKRSTPTAARSRTTTSSARPRAAWSTRPSAPRTWRCGRC